MFCCFLPTTLEISQFPTFFPTEYMYKTFATKDRTEKGDIYAFAVREMLCDAMDVKRVDISYAEKKEFWK